MTIQSLYGIIPNVLGKGRYARSVLDMMARMRRDIGVDADPPMTPQFDTLIIIDRTVDLTTPVVTQLTYEGLIDEFYGISHSEFPCRDIFLIIVLNSSFILIYSSFRYCQTSS